MTANGKLADSQLVTVDGWARLTPNTAAAYTAAKNFIHTHHNVSPQITPPYGAYRDLATQVTVKHLYGRLAATPGYSNHGLGIAFDMNNVTTVSAAVGGLGKLDGIMARFGFNRNASNGAGGIEQWHYSLVAVVDLAGVGGMTPVEVEPLPEPEPKRFHRKRRQNMLTFKLVDGAKKFGTNPNATYTFVGALGAGWIETTGDQSANPVSLYVGGYGPEGGYISAINLTYAELLKWATACHASAADIARYTAAAK